ncbi:phthioceranic/hydroxyphthioceranic acid synthase-like [Hyperolius riggenbachi]|uniref:phthioceranic/hydroxyphthioceranic acid synthase-like n=1 Tax=Hyperolius riggenbachi TaxID=752182 RepID=UPI0035A3A833
MDDPEDQIAIVGIGCNFPGGEGLDNFWKVIAEGRNCTVEIPEERFNTKLWYDSEANKPGKSHTCRAAIVEGIHIFDNTLFGIHNSESDRMDPQHKLLLECTYRALEDAGYTMEDISGSRTGVFIGLMNRDAEIIYNNCPENINHLSGAGTAMSIAANRISYQFNLTGPSASIDTACSSSLVALHLACQAIRQGDCKMAICGGVNCIMEPHIYVSLSKAKMISPEGTSKPFSKLADGYGRGEGCGVVVLKPLLKATEDYSKIWGVICASALNQDGRSVTPMTKPSQVQQEKLLKHIYTTIDPCSVQYVEAHGTGTPVGDPIEVTSIGNIIGKKRQSGVKPLKIGSVKGNIGHTESAAGMAALIKVLLMMHHEVIPPSLHYSKELGIKQIEESKLVVPTKPEKWHEDLQYGRVAGINCFGFGGTNGHAVIKQYKRIHSIPYSRRPVEIFILSAASSKSLQFGIEDTEKQLNKMPQTFSLENLVYTAACRRSHLNHKYRAAFLASSLSHLQQQLQSAKTETTAIKKCPEIVFVFCGNGVLSKSMCKILLENEPVFRKKCVEIDQMIKMYTSLSVVELLQKELDDFSSPDVAQLLLFTIQVSLVDLLKEWGVTPDCSVGHSVGEVAAAHCSGLLSLEDAVKVIYYRSKLQCKVTGGKMLVVGNVPVREISDIVSSYKRKACIAAYNSPSSCTLSGEEEVIKALHDHLTRLYSKRNIFLYTLDVPAAYHSHLMDPILEELKDTLQTLIPNVQKSELISTVTGKPARKGDFTTAEYWANNIREPVMFEQAIKASVNDKEDTVFIEIGPRKALQRNIVEILGPSATVIPVVQSKSEYETIFSMLILLFKKGYNPNWHNLFSVYKSSPAPIPKYQFDHIEKDINFEKIKIGNQSVISASHPLLQSMSGDYTEFKCTVSTSLTPYIYEHKHLGATLIPGAFYVELGLAAVVASLRHKVPLRSLVINATFSSPCVLQKDSQSQDLNVKIHQQDQVTDFEILTPNVLATGQVQVNDSKTASDRRIYIKHVMKRCPAVFKKDYIYEILSKFGFKFGQAYKQLCEVHYGEELIEGIARMKVSDEVRETMYEYHIHPVILDCFLQMVGCVVGAKVTQSETVFPTSISGLTIFQALQEEMLIYVKTIKITESFYEVYGCFADKNGFVLAEIKKATVTSMRQVVKTQENTFLQINWSQAPGSGKVAEKIPKMLVYADDCGISQQLSRFVHDELSYVRFNSWDSDIRVDMLRSGEWKDIVFMWGIHTVNDLISTNPTRYLAKCCEVYRQLILALRLQKVSGASIKTVTFRTTASTVDHVNPGFVLVGMTRACIIEVPEITFQLIDISSSSPRDVEALAEVLLHYMPSAHPEVRIEDGCIYTGDIAYTETERSFQPSTPMQISDDFTLCSSKVHSPADLFAEPAHGRPKDLSSKEIEIKIEKICAHTEDFFPVTLSSWQYGNTLYGNGLSPDKHKVIAVDFMGIVSAVGKEVRKIEVGHRVAACYPTVANSKVRIPESACYLTKKIPVLQETPCVSLFVLAWEILHNRLPHPKNKTKLTIVTTAENPVLCTILSKAAKQRGWETETSVGAEMNGKPCNAMIILPTSEVISGKDISQHPLLKDVVVIHNSNHFTQSNNLAFSCRQDIYIHMLDLATIFQSAHLQKHLKEIYKWLQSLSSSIPLILPKTMISPSISQYNLENSAFNYFTSQSVPLIELNEGTMTKIPAAASEPMLFKHNAVYIVTGGLTGLGFETVKFILQNGGGHIVILSRRKVSTQTEQQIAKVKNEKDNVKIIALSCDITLYTEIKKAIDSAQKAFPNIPIKGIFHSVVVLHDKLIESLNLSLFEKVLSPKVDGVVNLHNATLNQKLDYFVCYSSVASFLGNQGQANYAAANSFLDIFCQYRRNIGLPAQSINWGALDVGLLRDRHNVHDILKAKGVLLFNTKEIHAFLKKGILLNNTQQAIVKFDLKTMYDNLVAGIPTMRRRFYSVVVEHVNNVEHKNHVKQSKNNIQKPEDYILSIISELTSVPISDITMSSLLNSLGIDSMLAMTLQYRIFDDRKVNITLVRLVDPNTTIYDLVALIKESSLDDQEDDTKL